MVYWDFSQNILRRLCQMSTSFKWVLDVIGNLSFCLNWIFFFLYRMFKTGCDSISMRKIKIKHKDYNKHKDKKKTNRCGKILLLSVLPDAITPVEGREGKDCTWNSNTSWVDLCYLNKSLFAHELKTQDTNIGISQTLTTFTIFPTMIILQHIQ